MILKWSVFVCFSSFRFLTIILVLNVFFILSMTLPLIWFICLLRGLDSLNLSLWILIIKNEIGSHCKTERDLGQCQPKNGNGSENLPMPFSVRFMFCCYRKSFVQKFNVFNNADLSVSLNQYISPLYTL